ncbi:MAG: HIT family protein [Burkholderiaceae bacterium]|jgi:diadenosine tetraphosphate (Ap4A) HIT family hydrolase|nr:HIT family protein [Burkholderiaceae bacterium]
MDKPNVCTYCNLSESRIIDQSPLTLVFRDVFPVSPGHTLIIPRRHVESYFDLTDQEREDMTFMMMRAKNALKTELSPQAFNIGINEGFAAGQTVAHINMHLIPRFKGDVTEPRGGIRWIFPDKAVFWEKKPATVTTTETK